VSPLRKAKKALPPEFIKKPSPPVSATAPRPFSGPLASPAPQEACSFAAEKGTPTGDVPRKVPAPESSAILQASPTRSATSVVAYQRRGGQVCGLPYVNTHVGTGCGPVPSGLEIHSLPAELRQGGSQCCCSGCPACSCCDSPNGSSRRRCSNCRRGSRGPSLRHAPMSEHRTPTERRTSEMVRKCADRRRPRLRLRFTNSSGSEIGVDTGHP
jgi:hypothetical protein